MVGRNRQRYELGLGARRPDGRRAPAPVGTANAQVADIDLDLALGSSRHGGLPSPSVVSDFTRCVGSDDDLEPAKY